MFEDFNFPFRGVLLDPLIEDSYGPLINCDSCSTFDETSPFLATIRDLIICNQSLYNWHAISMQLVIVCNYFGHVCNYKFSIV
jgi:hypothetical protein